MSSHQTVYSLTRTRPDRSLSESRSTGKLTRTVLPQASAYAMIRRRPGGGWGLDPPTLSIAHQPNRHATHPPENPRLVSFQPKYLQL
jgi:hypothetical protein